MGLIEGYISPAIGSKRVKDIKLGDLQKILNDMAVDYSESNYALSPRGDKTKPGWKSTSYIKKVYNAINQIFKAAYSEGLVGKDVTIGLKLPKGAPPNERRRITDQERELTLKVAKFHHGGIFVLLMLYEGLRPGEVASLRWKDVDITKKAINVHSAIKAAGNEGTPKSKAGTRSIPIHPYLFDILSESEHDPSGLVCTNLHGAQYTKSSIRKMWDSFKRDMNIAAGCKTFRPKHSKYVQVLPPLVVDDLVLYDYRHTFCTDLERAGVPINIARQLMGHEDISTTAHIYTHSSPEAFDEAASKIEAFWDSEVAPSVASQP